ncbi:hypothetical protein C5167_022593 [Papaver somniferum]|uniref:Uncharacterized protein n=1 Tax=Papaver somniferum TaxID=3469 RepID=A0A4Y7JLC4_PAPSO|nr:thyroid adenoma-associated protein homolog [Papaver somniferum]RZC60822.1 hypothetical protein C5167_022593 [Papaver somniferum]
MSAKWRALQHRHRYTYTAIMFPQSYIGALNSLPSDTSSLKFFTELKELVSLNTIYSQVNNAKPLSKAFNELLVNGSEDVVSVAVRFYLEMLFFENSLPLHRTLVSVFVKCRNYQSEVAGCLRSLCGEYGNLSGNGKRFIVCRVALSMMSCPKLGFLVDIVDECCVLVALDVIFGLNGVVSEVDDGCRPSPLVMEQCQDALSCLYYLLQRFPSKFMESKDYGGGLVPKDSTIFEIAVKAILNILKSVAFSRDALVAAGASFCAALQVCMRPEELACFTAKAFYSHTSSGFIIDGKTELGVSDPELPYKGDLYSEIGSLSVLSRVCLLRGILTAVPRTVLNTHFVLSANNMDVLGVNESNGNSAWTILFDGILPELCNYCENPVDSHFNFHVLTVMQICMQQIKTSILAELARVSSNYDPLSEQMGARLLRIVWNNLEDPLSQTVKQVHVVFDLFLDIQSTLCKEDGSERIKSFLRKTASDLLYLGARCKGRYAPLASLTKRLGAKTILDINPNILLETTYAYIDDDVCCAATSFLKCFLECLRDECWSSDGIQKGYAIFRGFCLPPILHGLVSGVSKLRSNLNTYAVYVILEVDVDSIFPMLSFISVGQHESDTELDFSELAGSKMALTVDQQVAALVSLLKVCRLLALIDGDIDNCSDNCNLESEGSGDFALLSIKGIKVKVPVKWFVLALTHVDETLRIDAAESLFFNPKTASLPSHMELSLLKKSVPLNMRCCSTAFQMKWSSLFRKFFSRVRTALERQVKLGHWNPLSFDSNVVSSDKGMEGTDVHRAHDLFHFMRWFSSFLFFACYPSAPYERKIMAMELIFIMINTWPIQPQSEVSSSRPICVNPYSEGFTSPDSTLLLVESVIDSWDKLRENSFRILLHFPTPLPGISNPDRVKEVVAWAKKLICSPRIRECDAGALALRLIFRKYVLELGWIVGASVNVVCFQRQTGMLNEATCISESGYPVIEYILSLIDWMRVAVGEGEKDLTAACRNSFVHGVLLTLRYTFEELDWNSDVVLSSMSEMRHALEKLLELIERITSLALGVVSADAWHLPEDMDDMVDEDAFIEDVPVEMQNPESSSEFQVNSNLMDNKENSRPTEQIVMVGCWLAMKEVSLLLGTITRKVPLSKCILSDPSDAQESADELPSTLPDAILDTEQLQAIGDHFLDVLLKMKHTGAIDKTRAGFTALCNRLLCSDDPRLSRMTESWMEQLMERTVVKGQTVDDLLRRSAGIPAAFIALFLSEPEGTPKKLLPRALRWLIDVADVSLPNSAEANQPKGGSSNDVAAKPALIAICQPADQNKEASKIRDEGVIPTVHAFNVLRAAFNDTNLATDTSGFCAEALIIAIRSFSSPYWEVRNSACLAYTALVRRMLGFLNVQKQSARRALTALEFFHRYPALHPFLFNELKVATELLEDELSDHSKFNMGKVVHPSLCPILILLSRLKPSAVNCEADDDLDPFLFTQFIRRCSTQSNLKVRVLASRALTGLVSNEKLPMVLHDIARGLPISRNQTLNNSNSSGSPQFVSSNSIHGMLLQLISLLETNCIYLVNNLKKDHNLDELIQVLVTRSWIGTPKFCPCSILSTSYLKVLDYVLGIVRTCSVNNCFRDIRGLLLQLASECLDVNELHGSEFYDPTRAELLKQAALSYFNCAFQLSAEAADEGYRMLQGHSSPALDSLKLTKSEPSVPGLQERLTISISDPSYEVRVATLKCLLRFLNSTGSHDLSNSDINIVHQWANTKLQPTLMQLLLTEKNPKCTDYMLRLLHSWNLLQFQKSIDQQNINSIYVGTMDCDSMFQFWDSLISLKKVSTHKKVQQAVMCCIGICIKRFADLFRSSVSIQIGEKKTRDCGKFEDLGMLGHIYGCISTFVDLVTQHGAPSEPVNLRRAAADSIIASGLLTEAIHLSSSVSNSHIPSEEECSFSPSEVANLYARRILDLWFMCIKLLEDEDDPLREKFAEDVQRCFTSQGSGINHQIGLVPTQVEKVIELSFEFLSSMFGHWLVYFEYLSRCVLNTTSHTVGRGDLVKRVFDKEIDNHHEEKLMVCQICCFHLEKLPTSPSWAVGISEKKEVVIYLNKWRTRFYHQLLLFVNDYHVLAGGTEWIGGAGNHKEAFTSVYANLLGLYTLSRCLFNFETDVCMPQLSDLVNLGTVMASFLKNPLISNLYSLMIQSHEKMLGCAEESSSPTSRTALAIWEGFDPYFLLK